VGARIGGSMFLQNLCAMQWTNYLVDVVLAVVLIGYVVYCSKRGFIDCLFGFFSTIVAFLVAVFFAKAFVFLTGGLFGLRGAMYKGFTKLFMRLDGFNAPVVGGSSVATLKNSGVSAILARLVLKMSKGAPEGVMLAEAVGYLTAKLASVLLSGIIIFVAVKLLLRLTKGALEKTAEKIKILDATNTLLGAFAGFLGFTLLVSSVLAVLSLFPISAINSAIDNSMLVGFLSKYNPIVWLIGLLL